MNIPPRFQRWSSVNSLEALAEAVAAWADKMARTVADLWLPDVDASGASIPGNVDGQMSVAIFTVSGADVQVSHRLGHAPRNVTVCGLRILGADGLPADSHVTVSEGSRPPGDQIIALRCKFDPPATKVIARVLMHGGRGRPR